MQYYFYLDSVLMPVTPASMECKIGSKNKTFDLANGGEINIVNPPGLTEIRFELLLPQVQYPFAVYAGGFRDSGYYLELLEKLKLRKNPFEFMVIRRITGQLALRFAAGQIPYTAADARMLTGREDGVITSRDARILLQNENSGKKSYLSDMTMSVTLESYTILEDAEKYGRDVAVQVLLRQSSPRQSKTTVWRKT